jgi:mannitol-1-phosphate 5-dehydrogenase
VEPYNKLPVDKDGFKGDIPQIENMIPFLPFNYYIQRKLFMHNMSHAVTSYLGYLKGYTYIWEAIKDPTIKYIVLKALQESGVALSIKHEVSIKDILEHADNLIYRFSNKLLGDTVVRVGRDPVRKLSDKDRLVGAAEFCQQQEVNPTYIAIGIAAGYLFTPDEDDAADKIQDMIKVKGIEQAIKEYSNLKDSLLLDLVLKFYELFKQGKKVQEVMETAARFTD